VVIPTKSNVAGLMSVLGDVLVDGSVRSICVVVDGDEANRNLPALPVAVHRIVVPSDSGIQRMWNRGMATAVPDTHVVFLNDDVRLETDCLGSLARALDVDPTIGARPMPTLPCLPTATSSTPVGRATTGLEAWRVSP